MLKFAVVLAIASPVMLAGPARAADIATIGCLEKQLGETGPREIAPFVEAMVKSPQTRPEFPDALRQGLYAAAALCVGTHQWSTPAVGAATKYTLSSLALPVVRRVLGGMGLDASGLERVYRSMPRDVRESDFSEANFELFAEQAQAAGLSVPAGSTAVRQFYIYLNLMDAASVEFSRA